MGTWGVDNDWGDGLWGFDEAPPPVDPGVPGFDLTPDGEDPFDGCALSGTHRASLHAGWLQQDDVDFWIHDDIPPAEFALRTIFTLGQSVTAPGGVQVLGDWGRFRVSAPAGMRHQDGILDRHILGQDALRAALVRPWWVEWDHYAANPPQAALLLLLVRAGLALPEQEFPPGLSTDEDFIDAGNGLFGWSPDGWIEVTASAGLPFDNGDHWALVDTATDGDDFEVAYLDGSTVLERYFSGPVPAEFIGTGTLSFQYRQDDETVLLSIPVDVTDTVGGTSHSNSSGGLSATVTAAFWRAPWMSTMEGVVYSLLSWLSGDVDLVSAAGSLTSLGTEAGPYSLIAENPYSVLTQMGLLHYERETTWRDWLTEVCAPPGGAGAQTRWGIAPLVATYNAAGVLTLRRLADRWSNAWGWSLDDDHPVGVQLPVLPPFTEEIAEPEYDWLRLFRPLPTGEVEGGSFTPVAGAEAGEEQGLLGERRIQNTWYEYDEAYARPLEVAILEPSLEQILGGGGAIEWDSHYVGRVLDGLEREQVGEARRPSLSIRGPWYWAELGQEINLRDPPAVNGAYRVVATSTNLGDGSMSWEVARVADLGTENDE